MARPKGTGGQAKDLTPKDIKRIDRWLTGTRHEHRDRAIFFTGLGTGMRISEIVGLHIRDILPYGPEKPMADEITLELHSTKSKRSRTVPISKQARQHIQTYLDHRAADPSDPWPDCPWERCPDPLLLPLFPSQRNVYDPLQAQSACSRMCAVFDDAGVHQAKSHSMRRTFANRLRREGYDIKVIQELLGHRDVSTTSRYFSVSDEEKRLAVHDLEF